MYRMSLKRLRRYMADERNLNDIIDTAYAFKGFGIYRTIKPTQYKEEITVFAELCQKHSPKVIVEIGTAYGGVLYILSRYLRSCKKIISMDLDDRFYKLGFFRKRTKFIKEFAPDKEMHFMNGNSHDEMIEAELSKILMGEKIDLLFIDGDHSYAGVRDDFERYRKYVAPGGIIALHDVGQLEHVLGPPLYWKEIKQADYKTREIIFQDAKTLWGIGVVFIGN